MIVMHFHPHSPHAPHGERERGVFEGTRVSSNQGTWGATRRTQTMVILIFIICITATALNLSKIYSSRAPQISLFHSASLLHSNILLIWPGHFSTGSHFFNSISLSVIRIRPLITALINIYWCLSLISVYLWQKKWPPILFSSSFLAEPAWLCLWCELEKVPKKKVLCKYIYRDQRFRSIVVVQCIEAVS